MFNFTNYSDLYAFYMIDYVGRGMAAKAETPEETLGCDQLLRIHSAKKGFVNR